MFLAHLYSDSWSFFTLSTFILVFAEVSTYGTRHSVARSSASLAGTRRRSSKSHLLPTNKNGMFSSFFTRSIWSLVQKKKNKRPPFNQNSGFTFLNFTQNGEHMKIHKPKLLSSSKTIVVCDREDTQKALSATEVVVSVTDKENRCDRFIRSFPRVLKLIFLSLRHRHHLAMQVLRVKSVYLIAA